jgi:hypothetical protein|tara:strand:+ start:508 stop:951 length:444 start_codon:yes stop_codon:yes gene_type:complete
MGTVSQEQECQRCGYEHGYHEFQTRTREEYFMCSRCGHQVRYEITNLDSKDYKSGKNKGTQKKSWKPKYRTESIVPVASYTLKEKGALGKQIGPVPTDKDLENFKVNVQERSEELAQAKITYLCSEGEYLGKWVEEDLLENKVKLLK